jgi:predicted component of type VI protein secretion system
LLGFVAYLRFTKRGQQIVTATTQRVGGAMKAFTQRLQSSAVGTIFANIEWEDRTTGNSGKLVMNRELFNIGRDDDLHGVINSPSVSRKHAQIRLRGGVFEVKDIGSSYGTMVNGETIPKYTWVPLDEGSDLYFGDVRLQVIATGQAPVQSGGYVKTSRRPSDDADVRVGSSPRDSNDSTVRRSVQRRSSDDMSNTESVPRRNVQTERLRKANPQDDIETHESYEDVAPGRDADSPVHRNSASEQRTSNPYQRPTNGGYPNDSAEPEQKTNRYAKRNGRSKSSSELMG